MKNTFFFLILMAIFCSIAQARHVPDSTKSGWLDAHMGILFNKMNVSSRAIFPKGDTAHHFFAYLRFRSPGSRAGLNLNFGTQTINSWEAEFTFVVVDNDKIRITPSVGFSGSIPEKFGAFNWGLITEGSIPIKLPITLPIIGNEVSIVHTTEVEFTFRPNIDKDNLDKQGISTFVFTSGKAGIQFRNALTIGYQFRTLGQLEDKKTNPNSYRQEEPVKVGVPKGLYLAVMLNKNKEFEIYQSLGTGETWATLRWKFNISKKHPKKLWASHSLRGPNFVILNQYES